MVRRGKLQHDLSGGDDATKARAVMDKLYKMAVRGNAAAASIFLDRVLGAVRAPAGPTLTRVSAPTPPEPARRESLDAPGPARSEPGRPRTLLSVADVAGELGLSTALIYQLGKRGRLPICRIGRRILVRAADLERFISENSSGFDLPP